MCVQCSSSNEGSTSEVAIVRGHVGLDVGAGKLVGGGGLLLDEAGAGGGGGLDGFVMAAGPVGGAAAAGRGDDVDDDGGGGGRATGPAEFVACPSLALFWAAMAFAICKS